MHIAKGVRMIKGLAIGAAAGAVIAGGAAGVAATASGSTQAVPQKCQAAQPSPASRHVITWNAGLAGWASRHGSYIGNVLGATYSCEDGWQQYSFLNYLNAGNLSAPMPKGTVLWAVPYHSYHKP